MAESGYPCLIGPCVTIVFASIEPRTAGAAKKQGSWLDADKHSGVGLWLPAELNWYNLIYGSDTFN
jgi:hypothetical protein